MHGTPGGLKLFTNEKRVFVAVFGWITSSKWSISLLFLLLKMVKSCFFTYLVLWGKIRQGYRRCGSWWIMRIRTTTSCQMPWFISFNVVRTCHEFHALCDAQNCTLTEVRTVVTVNHWCLQQQQQQQQQQLRMIWTKNGKKTPNLTWVDLIAKVERGHLFHENKFLPQLQLILQSDWLIYHCR